MLRTTSHSIPTALTVLAVLLLPTSGCNALEFVPLVKAEATLSEDFRTSNSPKIVIDTFNGRIDVSRGKPGQVLVDVTKRASGVDQAAAEAALNTVQVSMVQKDNTLTIIAKRLDHRPGTFGASVVIAVPAAAELDIQTSNGRVVCEHVEGAIDAHSSNGKLEIVGARGPLKLKTSNGGIEIEASDAVVDARTSNGRIEFHGQLASAKQQFKTSNGRIDLVLPAGADFRFDGHTSNGRIHSDFNIDTGESRRRRNDVEGIVGSNPNPECTIAAVTSNGSITLSRAAAKKD